MIVRNPLNPWRLFRAACLLTAANAANLWPQPEGRRRPETGPASAICGALGEVAPQDSL